MERNGVVAWSKVLLFALVVALTGCAAAPKGKPPEPPAPDTRTVEELTRSGNLNFSRGKYGEAVDDFSKVIQGGGGSAAVYTTRGRVYFEMGRYNDALADLDRAVGLAPGSDTAWNTRGYILYSMGRNEEALKDLDKALAINPRHEAAYNHRGLVRLSLEQYGPALSDFDRALDVDPGYYEVYANRGDALWKLGRREEAAAAWREYLTRANPSRDARRVGQVRERLRSLEGS